MSDLHLADDLSLQSFDGEVARFWPGFVDCPQRMRTLGPFLRNKVGFRAGDHILDAAAGSGCEARFLQAQGCTVVANEIARDLRRELKKDLAEVCDFDWLSFGQKFHPNEFDGILLLGNSLSLLLDEGERKKVLRGLFDICASGGKLAIDQRNYELLWRQRNDLGGFTFKRQVMYCGSALRAVPREIARDHMVMDYVETTHDRRVVQYELATMPGHWLEHELRACGFSVQRYFDLGHGTAADSDFVTYVATKAGSPT